MKKKNYISIAMCTYNGAKFIERQIESILNQTHPADEIVIVDDCSEDATVEIVKELLVKSDIESKIICNEERMGAKDNFRKAILQCSGNIIFTCDQDDYWVEKKIEKMLKAFEENEKAVLVFSDGALIDESDNIIFESTWESFNAYASGFKGSKSTTEEIRNLIFYRPVVSGCMMAMEGNFAKEIFKESNFFIHDYWASLCAPIYGEIVAIDDKLINYRQHENNVIGAGKHRDNCKNRKIKHIERILFTSKDFEKSCKIFLDLKEPDLSVEYKKYVKRVLKKFSKIKNYHYSSNVKKFFYLLLMIIKNELKYFNISRKDLCIYVIEKSINRKN